MRKQLYALLFVLFWAMQAGAIPIPDFNINKKVHIIATNTLPEFVERDVADINTTANGLHFPFYVVVIEDLQTDNKSVVEQTAVAIVQAWRQTGFDVQHANLFVLSYHPRSYWFLPGTLWKTSFNMNHDALKAYTGLFDQSVKMVPKDPAHGIVNLMKAFDNAIFDLTDPVRIKERIKQEQEKRRQEAQAVIAQQKAESEVRAERRARAEKRGEMIETIALIFLGISVLVSSGMILKGVIRTRKEELKNLHNSLKEWNSRLQTAATRYVMFHEQDREAVLSLKNTTGKTKAIYHSMIEDLDDLYLKVFALRLHLDECIALFKTGSIWNMKPVRKAWNIFTSPFEINSQKVPSQKLFVPDRETTTCLHAWKVEEEAEKQYADIMATWKRLQEVSVYALKPAEDHFPNKLYGALCQKAGTEIPLHWLKDHPLAEDVEGNESIYHKLNAIRLSDPITFHEQMEAVKQKGKMVEAKLDTLLAIVAKVDAIKQKPKPEVSGIHLDVDDDPTTVYTNLLGELEKFTDWLASKTDINDIKNLAQKIEKIATECDVKHVAVKDAIAKHAAELRQGEQVYESLMVLREHAVSDAQEATRYYNDDGPHRHLKLGSDLRQEAEEMLRRAKEAQESKRYVLTRQLTASAIAISASSRQEFERAIKARTVLREQKEAYMKKLAGMETRHKKSQERVRSYGGDASRICAFEHHHAARDCDYGTLLHQLEATERSWDMAIHQARIKEDARHAEAERLRSASASFHSHASHWGHSHSSSDSSSSWGGGSGSSSGSDSSSSSFDSGGSSDSGGSGGDW